MKPILRRWRGLLIGSVVALLAAETIILHTNEMPLRLEAVRIHHDEFGHWLVLRVENRHLSPIKIIGLNSDPDRIPWAAYRLERASKNGPSEELVNGGCTSRPCIIVSPLSSREVIIHHPIEPGERTDDRSWRIRLWAMNTSLIWTLNPWESEKDIDGYFYPAEQTLPDTGDPEAKERAERNSCCGGKKEEPAPSTENPLP